MGTIAHILKRLDYPAPITLYIVYNTPTDLPAIEADLAIDNPQTPTELAGVLERFCECGHLVPPEEWRASIESLRARG